MNDFWMVVLARVVHVMRLTIRICLHLPDSDWDRVGMAGM